jgi:cytochrome c556
VRLPDWQKYAQDLQTHSLAALTAVRAKDVKAISAAGGDFLDTCEACHKQFKPNLPTEGILHPHYR